MNRVLGTYRTMCESKIEIIPYVQSDDIIKFNVEIIDLSGNPTRNGVIYPKEEFKKALNAPDVVQRLRTGAFYGEYDHPIDPNDIKRWMRQEMPYVTHKWNKFWFDGSKLMGECQTFTGNGNLMGHAIKGGELPSFSIRVLGTPREENGNIVLSDIVLSTIDWVRYPGNPTSYVNSSSSFTKADNYLEAGFDYNTRPIPSYSLVSESFYPVQLAKAESTGIVTDDQELLSMGEGYFVVVDKVSPERNKELTNMRLKSFG